MARDFSTVNQNGQVTIPKHMRDALGIKNRDIVFFKQVGNEIILTPKKVQIVDLAPSTRDQ